MSKITHIKDATNDTLIITEYDAVYFKVSELDEGLIKWLCKKFTYRIENYRYHPRVKMGVWDGRVSLIDSTRNLMPISLLEMVVEEIKKAKYSYYLDVDKSLIHDFDLSGAEVYSFTKDVMKSAPFDWEDRDYQMRCITTSLKTKRAVIEASVGAGKSFIIYIIIRYLLAKKSSDFKILLAVPTIMLVHQMVQDWADYGWDGVEEFVEILHGKANPSFTTPVLVSTWQSIYKRKEKFFKDYDCILFDEAHTASSESLLGIAKKCVNAEYRIGLTGTMPDEKINEMNIISYLGPVRESVSTQELTQKGVLTPLRVVFIDLIYDKRIYQIAKNFDYQAEIGFISEYPERYKKIVGVHKRFIKSNENTLILSQKIDQINNLVSAFRDAYGKDREIMVIHGKVKDTEREMIRKSIATKEGVILIATFQTMSTGVNIPKLHHIMLASPYKSKIKIIQSLGRVLRRHDTKIVAYLWDFVDNLMGGYRKMNFSMKHKVERKKHYVREGFPMKEMKISMGEHGPINTPRANSVWIKK